MEQIAKSLQEDLRTPPSEARNNCKINSLRQNIFDACFLRVQFMMFLFILYEGKTAMPIDPWIEQGVFEPEAAAAMGQAFDAVCREVPASGQSHHFREVVATLIIAAAVHGELDPVRLRTAVLSGLSSVTEISCPYIPATRVEQ
jgi:hypothetical protein